VENLCGNPGGSDSIVPRKHREHKNPDSNRRLTNAASNSAPGGNSSFRSKHSLAAASRPLAKLVETFDEFLFELDADGTFMGMWSSSQDLTGRQSNFLGRHAMEVLGEDVFRPFGEVFHRVIATGESKEIEFPANFIDGQHWFHALVLPVARRFRKTPSVSLLTRDITAQKKTEIELRKSESLLAQAEQVANIGSWEIDPQLRTVLCSDNLYRLFGLEHRRRKIDMQELSRNVHPDDAVEAHQLLQSAIATGRPFEHDFRYVSPAGEQRNFHARGSPFCDPEGHVLRVVGVTEDITDRLKVEERMRDLSDRLFTLRDEEQRRLARDLHETVLQGLAALKMALARVGDTLPKRDKIGNKFLLSARKFAEEVIQQIRTVSYLLHPVLLEEAGLGPALRSFVAGFSERSGIRVKVAIRRGFGRLPKEMEIALFRVVQEALTNIHRHSKSAAATIHLRRANGKVRIEVKDQGVGMALPSTAGGTKSRLGIGIAGMCERVKQLGGVLEIQSQPSRGTTISVELPIAESPRASDENPEIVPPVSNFGRGAKSERAGS
jgi:PAS domain S-box-containing protein